MRMRLKPSYREIPFLSPFGPDDNNLKKDIESPNGYITAEKVSKLYRMTSESQVGIPLSESRQREGLKPGERLLSFFCSRINPFSKRDGEILIGESSVYFMDDGKVAEKKRIYVAMPKNLAWACEDIMEVHKRRYLLRNNALEIFLTNGKTYLLAFAQQTDRDTAYDRIMSLNLPNRVNYESEVSGGMLKMSITKKWKKGLISNFEYLMHLNTIAGRSFNDLTQYPVFPLILANYSGSALDANQTSTFRDLSKPMGAQEENRLKKFEERFEQLIDMGEEPFHYGSHYSNIGTVLHFLVRLEPFSRYFIEFQGDFRDVE